MRTLRGRGLAWTAMVAWVSACADLSSFPRDVCGNGIVERSNGEDCDTFPVGVCGAPNTPGQCRLLCTFGASPTTCPADYGCGSDGICRQESGRYLAGDFVRADAVARLESGDFDGDGRADLLTLGDLGTQEQLFAGGASFTTLPVSRRIDSAQIYRLQPQGAGSRDDVVIVDTRDPSDRGIVVYDVTPGGVLDTLPAYQAKVGAFGPFDQILIARIDTGLLGNLSGPDDLLLAVRSGSAELLATTNNPAVQVPFDQDAAPPILVGRLDEDPQRSPCEQAVFLFPGSDKVRIFRPCVREGPQLVWNSDANGQLIQPLSQVQRKDGNGIDGAALGDINGDGHLDIVTWTEMTGACAKLYRAYGVGDGTFNSTPSIPTSSGDGLMDTFGPGEALSGTECIRDHSAFILKDLNGDGRVDVVTRDGVFSGGAPLVRAQSPWAWAAVGDFDADGHLDLVVSTTSRPSLTFYLGFSGIGIERHVDLAAGGYPGSLTVGDYDGDGAQDVAFLNPSVPGGADAAIAVAFGQPFGLPNPPAVLAQGFDPTSQLVAAALSSIIQARERLSDLNVVQEPDLVTYFPADPYRELVAPLELTTSYPQMNESLSIRAARAGRFDLTGAPGAAVLTLVDPMTEEESVEPMVLDSRGSLQAATRALPATPNAVPTVPGYKFSSYSAMAAADLDHDGVDELVLLGNILPAPPSSQVLGSTGPYKGQLLVAHRRAAAPTSGSDWEFDTPLLLDESFTLDDTQTLDAFVDPRDVRVADVDADGTPDVLTFGKLGNATVLSLYRGKGSWALGAADRVVFGSDSPELDRATSFALLGSTGATALFLTPDGPFLGELDVSSAKVKLSATPLAAYVARDASSGDFDADGVRDWAIASHAGVQLLYGVPTLP